MRRSRYRGTTLPCYADVARHLRRIIPSISNCLGLQKRQRCDAFHVLAFPRYCPKKYVRFQLRVSTDMSQVSPRQSLSLGRTTRRRSKPSSRTALMGEQPNPWDRLQPQDATSRHRGAKPSRRYGLLGKMSLLSPGYLLSVEQRRFHKPPLDHYALLSHLLD